MRADSNGKRSVLLSLLIALVVPALVACWSVPDSTRPVNFGHVIEGGIYRGGQPDSRDFEMLRELGVRTVLKLNNHGLQQEREEAERAGIRLIHVPFNAKTIGQPATCGDVARALEVLSDESNWPIYVHCSRGRDRAGYIVGLYRQQIQQWPWSRIDTELEAYGHDERLRRSYPQIARELREGVPSCSVVLRAPGA